MRYKIVAKLPTGRVLVTGKGRHKSYKDKHVAEQIALDFSNKKSDWKFRVVEEDVNIEYVFNDV